MNIRKGESLGTRLDSNYIEYSKNASCVRVGMRMEFALVTLTDVYLRGRGHLAAAFPQMTSTCVGVGISLQSLLLSSNDCN